MQVHKFSSRWRAAVLLAAGMLALFALAACGSDDDDAPVAGAPPTQAPAPTATPAPAPPAVPMVPATVPKPGSDEEQVMAVLEKQVRAVHAADYVAFQETCTPTGGKSPTVAQLKYVFEERGGRIDAVAASELFTFSPQGFNVRNVEVKLLRAPFAQASFQIYDYDKLVIGRPPEPGQYRGPVIQVFEKVDGQWYSETAPCGQNFPR